MSAGKVKAEPCKTFPQPAPNETDVERSIERMKSNDSALTDLNLNNMQVCRDMRSCELLLPRYCCYCSV